MNQKTQSKNLTQLIEKLKEIATNPRFFHLINLRVKMSYGVPRDMMRIRDEEILMCILEDYKPTIELELEYGDDVVKVTFSFAQVEKEEIVTYKIIDYSGHREKTLYKFDNIELIPSDYRYLMVFLVEYYAPSGELSITCK